MKTLVLWLSIVLMLGLALRPAWGQSHPHEAVGAQGHGPSDQTRTVAPDIPVDDFDRGTPRRAVEGFRQAARIRDYGRAAEYLDLRWFPTEKAKILGPQLARHLKIVMDQQVPIDIDSLSDSPAGYLEDALPPDMEQVGRIETQGKPVYMRLQRVPREDGVGIWKLSAASVAAIPDLYKQYGYGLFGELMPSVFLETEFLDTQLRQWFALAILVGFGSSSLDLEVFSYVTVTDAAEYLEVAEDLNLRIMDIVATAGSSFALSSQTTYVETSNGRDPAQARAAEAQVREWRERGELYLPSVPLEKIAENDNALGYSADGAALGTGPVRR